MTPRRHHPIRAGLVSYNQPALGGGNFLMALGLFSALNFLAKIHRRLNTSEASLPKMIEPR
jgi:hypothetical protein